jgi:hypothetical protein
MRFHIVMPDQVMREPQEPVRDVAGEAGRFPPEGCDVLPQFSIVVVDWKEGVTECAGELGRIDIMNEDMPIGLEAEGRDHAYSPGVDGMLVGAKNEGGQARAIPDRIDRLEKARERPGESAFWRRESHIVSVAFSALGGFHTAFAP